MSFKTFLVTKRCLWSEFSSCCVLVWLLSVNRRLAFHFQPLLLRSLDKTLQKFRTLPTRFQCKKRVSEYGRSWLSSHCFYKSGLILWSKTVSLKYFCFWALTEPEESDKPKKALIWSSRVLASWRYAKLSNRAMEIILFLWFPFGLVWFAIASTFSSLL